MSKLGDALGLSAGIGGSSSGMDDMSSEESPSSVGEPKDKPDDGSAELMAMKMFKKASTPEAMVGALKAFLEACGAIGSDY